MWAYGEGHPKKLVALMMQCKKWCGSQEEDIGGSPSFVGRDSDVSVRLINCGQVQSAKKQRKVGKVSTYVSAINKLGTLDVSE